MSETPFHRLDDYIALRRPSNLTLSPDGRRLVLAVQQLNHDRTAWVSSLWEVDPAGEREAVRLTRSAPGESSPGFTPEGELLFVSKRPDARAGDDEEKPQLWALPERGEARLLAQRPGGVAGFAVARDSGAIVLGAATMPGADTAEEDRSAREHRKKNKISALLHDGEPIRYWDHDLGPDTVRLFLGEGTLADALAEDAGGPGDAGTGQVGGGDAEGSEGAPGEAGAPGTDATATGGRRPRGMPLRDLTPDAGGALFEPAYDLAPDGGTVVSTWLVPLPGGDRRSDLRTIDPSDRATRTIASDPDHDFGSPRVSPDGRYVVAVRSRRVAPGLPPAATLWTVDLATGEQRDLTAGLDLLPQAPRWSPDGATVYFTADERGRCPVFAVEVGTGDGGGPGEVRRLVSDAAYSDLQVAPDGGALYALRSAVDAPPEPVRLDPAGTDQDPVLLRGPQERPAIPGTLTEVFTTAEDGTGLRAWLALPPNAEAEPAPLLLWIHGGPYHSWNSWQWRWNPWTAVARGYAVALPDPALSTGYGEQFLRRGFGRWGDAPYTDLMTITDAVVARPDIDAFRTAAMGGSFGGYMANWIAGHTDRFRAIVTHASLWALDQFGSTTDFSAVWYRELEPDAILEHSPQRYRDAIVTPMLVIHGDKDYRVPIGEGLRLWNDLVRGWDGEPGTLPHRFLYFPDENHWVLTPQHVKLWYETIFAFLSWHLLGGEWQPPAYV